MLTYGVEVTGMSCSHLRSARRAIARAVSPDAGGKHHDLVLHVADGAHGTLDPGFDAHGLPIWMWSLAHWEEWLPQLLDEAMRHATSKVITIQGLAKWRSVTGPAAAATASAARLGWRFDGGQVLVADDGSMYDLRLDPPIVVLQAVHRAVRRWRLERIGLLFPVLLPKVSDVQVPTDRAGSARDGMVTTTFSFADTLDGLLQARRGAACKLFADWEPKHKCYLRSVICGGQWPQARIAAVPGWSDDLQCQLCHSAVGTLAHRPSNQALP